MGKEIILRATKEDYKRLSESLGMKVTQLQHEVDNYDSVQRAKCCECCEKAIQDYSDLYTKTDCFRDDYFKDLLFEDIAKLAKKSIRLTADNCRMQHKLEDIAEINDNEKN